MRNKLKGFFKKAGKMLWLSDKMTMVLVVCIAVVSLCMVTAKAEDTGSTKTNQNIGGLDMTISRFSELIAETFSANVAQGINQSAAVAYFMDNVDNVGDGGMNMPYNAFGLHNVGNVLGYAGTREDTSNASNIWTDGSDVSSKMMTLETVMSLHMASGETEDDVLSDMEHSAIASYIIFGSALNYMGVDEFRDAKSAADGTRMVVGYAAYVLFILAYSASNIMKTVVDMLQSMNVFMWIYEGSKSLFEAILGVENLEDIPLMAELLPAFEVLKGLRWVILGFLVIFFVASITVWKTQGYNRAASVQQKGRQLVYRLIVMCIGIPLCGMIYTEGLDIVGKLGDDTDRVITSYIFQEFMNFEDWTTRSMNSEGALQAFRTGAQRKSDDGTQMLGNPFSTITVEYESAGHRFTIKCKNDWDVIGEFDSSGGYHPATVGRDGINNVVLDASQFVYAVNEAVYGEAVTGSAMKANYVTSLYNVSRATGDGTGKSYAELIEQDADMIPSDPEEAYKACRDLLLNYARSNTVKPDTLNSYYLDDIQDIVNCLVTVEATVADEGGDTGSDDDTASNQASALNAGVIERLFGSDSADQRIWSFVDLKAPWVYPSTDSAKTIDLLSTTFDGENISVTAELYGLTAAARWHRADSTALNANGGGIRIVGPNDTRYIMHRTLSNGVPYTVTGTASSSESVSDPRIFIDEHSFVIDETDSMVRNYKYVFKYHLSSGGMSPLALYNYMHSKFENGTLTVYSPKLTSNAGVGTMHYAVTTPYSGIPELVNLLYTLAILFSLGIIGWVFGVSLLINSIVQLCKALPTMFKMLMGSVQGFVEGLLIAFSVIVELLVTITLYTLSIKIIDFLIRLIRGFATFILNAFLVVSENEHAINKFNAIDGETLSIVSGLLSTAVILWGTFNLIKWRQAITISIKSIITNMMNKIFGTSAAMPTGASSGMLKGAAALAAGGMIAGSLAEQGTLDDVVNDLTQSDLGSSVHDKLDEGDYEGALQDIKDYANGTYVSSEGDIDRGASDTWDASQQLGDGYDSLDGTFSAQSLTDAQQAELDEGKEDLLAARDKYEQLANDENASPEEVAEAKKEYEDMLQERAAKAAQFRKENGEKAKELGVADYGDYLRNQGEEAEANGLTPLEGADIPEDPGSELDADGQAAYDAARDGDAETLRSLSNKYDANGLTEDQRAEIDDMIANGASEAEVAKRVEEMAEENFGEYHGQVVDKMNEAAGRDGSELYGSNDNSDGNARTMAVKSGVSADGSRNYAVKDNSSDEGVKTFETNEDGNLEQQFGDDLPEDVPSRINNPDAYEAALSGDPDAIADITDPDSENYLNENGLSMADQEYIDNMVANGASAEDVAAEIEKRAMANLGPNHKAAMERINSAAGRGNHQVYGARDEDGNLTGEGPTMDIKASKDAVNGTDWNLTDSDGNRSTFQTDGKGGVTEIPTQMADVPSKQLDPGAQAVWEAAKNGDTDTLQAYSSQYNNAGITQAQEQSVAQMAAAGASEAEIAAAVDNFAQQNFGDDYKQVIDSMNQAAGRDNTMTIRTSSGGGEDGTSPRQLTLTSGYQDGQAAYSVTDFESGEAHTITVSDQDGQSFYQDQTKNADGRKEEFATLDFGSSISAGQQTYADIRNQVDSVANNSNGMLSRKSGRGAGASDVTVSEAASLIAARQSQEISGGSRSTNVGGDNTFWQTGDLTAYNNAATEAAKNAGIDQNQITGIAGGVNVDTGIADNGGVNSNLQMIQNPYANAQASASIAYGNNATVNDVPFAADPNFGTTQGQIFTVGGQQTIQYEDPNGGGANAGIYNTTVPTGGAANSGAYNTAAPTGGGAVQVTEVPEEPQNNTANEMNAKIQKAATVAAVVAGASAIYHGQGVGSAITSASYAYNGATNLGGNLTGANSAGNAQTVTTQTVPAGNGGGATGGAGGTQATMTYTVTPTQVNGPNGTTMTVVPDQNGVMHTVDNSGNMTNQMAAVYADGSYATVVESNGTYKVAGTGQEAVKISGGGFAIVGDDGSGNKVLMGPSGPTSTKVSQNASGEYQATITRADGSSFAVDANNNIVGEVVKGANGNSYTVTPGKNGDIHMANPDGSAGSVLMANCGNGTWAPVNTKTGGIEGGASNVQVVKMANGDNVTMCETSTGQWMQCDAQGNVDMSKPPLTQTANGFVEARPVGTGGKYVIDTPNGRVESASYYSKTSDRDGQVAVVYETVNGKSTAFMADAKGNVTDVPLAKTADNGYMKVVFDGSGNMRTQDGNMVIQLDSGELVAAIGNAKTGYYIMDSQGGQGNQLAFDGTNWSDSGIRNSNVNYDYPDYGNRETFNSGSNDLYNNAAAYGFETVTVPFDPENFAEDDGTGGSGMSSTR